MGEEQLIAGSTALISYGALGVVAVYFMIKDWIVSKSNTDALHKFAIVLEKLCIKLDSEVD